MLEAALAGQLFGFVGSMPVAGPIAVLVLSRSLDGRRRDALAIALGGALTEAAYAFLAYCGFSAFLADVPWIVHASRAVGAALLLLIGVALLRRREEPRPDADRSRAGAGFALGFTVSALNPTFLVTWTTLVGVFSSICAIDSGAWAAAAFAGGVCVGIVAWFVVAVWLVGRFRDHVTATTLSRCHRGFGWLVVVLGAALGAAFVDGLAGA